MQIVTSNYCREEALEHILAGKTISEFRAFITSKRGTVTEPSAIPSETQSEMVRDIGRFGYSVAGLIRAQADPGKHAGGAVLENEIANTLASEALEQGR